MKLYIALAVISLHSALLFLVVFKTETTAREPETIRLVNLSDIEEYREPTPEKPAPRLTQPENAVVQEDIAENITETEEEFVETAFSAGDTSGDAEIDSAYIKENYGYVQRRILRELIYPNQARRTGVQGVVEVLFTINLDGSVCDVIVRRSSGKNILDEEALRAVQSASPFRRPSAPVRIIIPVSFKLTGVLNNQRFFNTPQTFMG